MSKLQRVKKVIKWLIYQEVADNDKEIAEKLGYSKSSFSQIINEKVPISERFIENLTSLDRNINKVWIETGKGEMFKINDNNLLLAKPILTNRKTKDSLYDQQRIPLFNLEATMGLVPVVNGNGLDEEKILDYISIPSMAICDGAIYATGDSMYPLLKAGDIVAYKKVEVNPDTIFFGEIYIVALYLDELTTMKTIKFVQKSDLGDEYVKLVSHNSHHAPKDYKLNQIAAMGLVRASIRLHN